MDQYTALTIKCSMGLSSSTRDTPLYASKEARGKGLVSLVDMQEAIQCNQTTIEMNSNGLSSTMSKNTWYLQWRIEGHTNMAWTDALQ